MDSAADIRTPRPRSSGASRAAVVLLLVSAVAGACSGPPASGPSTSTPSPREPSPSPTASAVPSPEPSPSVSAEPTPLPIAVPSPGHQLTPEALLDAMRASRRPGGVPDALETPSIAAAVADRLWTFDGRMWPTWSVGGACGPSTCSLEIGGTADGALGEDLYVFAIEPATGSVELTDLSLGGTPSDLVEPLDAAARELWDGDLSGLVLTSVAWQPPPDEGTFVLTYRSGGEEGSPGVTLVLDVLDGTVEAG